MSLYVADKIKLINENLKKGLDKKDLDALEEIKVPLKQLSDHIRESLQASLRGNIEMIIKRLRRDETLTGDDIDTIKKWLVGDAQYYTKIENNYEDWVKELKRLSSAIGKYSSESEAESETSLFTLNALLVDLRYTLSDVIRYINYLDRVKRFSDTSLSSDITSEDKKILADLIERQLYSEDF